MPNRSTGPTPASAPEPGPAAASQGTSAPVNAPLSVPVLGPSFSAPAVAPSPDFLITPALSPPGFPRDAVRASFNVSSGASEVMPAILRDQLSDLEAWALANQKDARNDSIRFWALKIPAIVASASAGIFAFYEWEVAPLIAGAIGSACVVIDGLNPGGALRNAHYKAFYRLRDLEAQMVAMWRIEAYKATTPIDQKALASRIIKDAQKKRDKISDELEKAETALGKK